MDHPPVDKNLNSPEDEKNSALSSGKGSLLKKIYASGFTRFAGWWSIFAGALAINSVCPICGSTACPVGIGTTGVIAGIIAAVKQWGGSWVRSLVNLVLPWRLVRKTDHGESCSCGACHVHTAENQPEKRDKSA